MEDRFYNAMRALEFEFTPTAHTHMYSRYSKRIPALSILHITDGLHASLCPNRDLSIKIVSHCQEGFSEYWVLVTVSK